MTTPRNPSPASRLAAAAGALLLAGCAINQSVTPVGGLEVREICIVDNPAVRATFLEALRKAVAAKGYTVRVLPANSPLRECPVTVTYTANWRWDLALYMAYAEINVFKAGAPAGKAVYDSLGGGANMGKFISAEDKVNELVNQLMAGGAR